MPKPRDTNWEVLSTRPLLFTLNVRMNTGCQVKETGRLFPRIPWGISLALKTSWLSRSPNKMCQMKIFAHRTHFLASWAQIPYLLLHVRSKGKTSRFLFYWPRLLSLPPHLPDPNIFQKAAEESYFICIYRYTLVMWKFASFFYQSGVSKLFLHHSKEWVDKVRVTRKKEKPVS